MNHSPADTIIIQTFGFGPVMTARQSIKRAKNILLDLERISPWRRPFDVGGCTAGTGDMPIAEDLSDFDDVVMRALESYDDVRYYNENNPTNINLTLDSISPYGFRETFSEARTGKEYKNCVVVRLRSSGSQNDISLNDSLYNVEIPAFEPRQVNEVWSDISTILRIFNYFIDNYDPLSCVVYGRAQLCRIRTPESNYNMGWLNYTKDPKVADVFYGTGKAFRYRNGVLLKFGDHASALSDPKVDQELIEIRKTLRSVGVIV
jgi:hypothetical protein